MVGTLQSSSSLPGGLVRFMLDNGGLWQSTEQIDDATAPRRRGDDQGRRTGQLYRHRAGTARREGSLIAVRGKRWRRHLTSGDREITKPAAARLVAGREQDDRIAASHLTPVREIRGHLEDLYGIDVSPDLISSVTDAVLEVVAG